MVYPHLRNLEKYRKDLINRINRVHDIIDSDDLNELARVNDLLSRGIEYEPIE